LPLDEALPYRLIAVQLLETQAHAGIHVKPIGHTGLIHELRRLGAAYSGGASVLPGRRLARFYDGSSGTPTIFVLKPDAVRYWTRSMALNDADQVSADLFHWQAAGQVADR
jgi:hypothetical protein